MPSKSRNLTSPQTNEGRSCQTPHCPGRLLVLRRKNRSDHITRRLQCELCGLRTTSIERMVQGTTSARDRAAAIKKLAAVRRVAAEQ
jgi:hypothetical protein